jgi:hypothetical protein
MISIPVVNDIWTKEYSDKATKEGWNIFSVKYADGAVIEF